jgi:hypothetical protein
LPQKNKTRPLILLGSIVAVIIILAIVQLLHNKNQQRFTDHFHSLQNDALAENGWFVQSKDSVWWNRRNERPHFLTLFTLRGDNGPDSVNAPLIKNRFGKKNRHGIVLLQKYLWIALCQKPTGDRQVYY